MGEDSHALSQARRAEGLVNVRERRGVEVPSPEWGEGGAPGGGGAARVGVRKRLKTCVSDVVGSPEWAREGRQAERVGAR